MVVIVATYRRVVTMLSLSIPNTYHPIDLVPDPKLPEGPIYPLSKKELDGL